MQKIDKRVSPRDFNGRKEFKLPNWYPMELNWIESTGGPLLLLEDALLAHWHGSYGNSGVLTDYDRACKIADYIGIIEVGGGTGLLLGEEPFATSWWSSDQIARSFLVRWVAAENEEQVRAELNSLPSESPWQSADVNFEIYNGQLTLFDSACLGSAIDAFLTIEIPRGSYAVETLHYDPSDKLSLILHRFIPRPDA